MPYELAAVVQDGTAAYNTTPQLLRTTHGLHHLVAWRLSQAEDFAVADTAAAVAEVVEVVLEVELEVDEERAATQDQDQDQAYSQEKATNSQTLPNDASAPKTPYSSASPSDPFLLLDSR